MSRGILYFVQAGADGPIKVGWTADLARRLQTLQTASPQRLRLLGHLPGTREMERAVHRHLGADRMHGEWFAPTPKVVGWATMAEIIGGRHPRELPLEDLRADLASRPCFRGSRA